MPRTSRPWFRRSRGQWFVTMKGKQIGLGVTDPQAEAAALAAFRALLAGQGQTSGPRWATCAELVAAYLEDCAERVRPHTLKGYGVYLRRFLARFGTVQPGAVDAAEVERDSRRNRWSDTNRANYLRTIEQCLRWAGVVIRLRKPPRASAGADSVIPESVYWQVLGATRGDRRALVEFLWHTGARPAEAANLTAEQIDLAAGTALLKEHKTSHRGKPRVLYLSQPALAIVRQQLKRHGSGYLFRGLGGRPFSRQSLVMAFRRISERIGHRVTAYQFRHTWATRALAKGLPDAHVAALLGHANTAMLHRNYSHLTANSRLLLEAAERVAG